MTIDSLRQNHNALKYQNFHYELNPENMVQLSIRFNFFLEPNIKFSPTVNISGIDPNKLKNISTEFLESQIFQLGLAELPSYWKAACPQEVIVEAGFLDKNQVDWWHNLFIQGLGEFFYTNQIDFTQPDFLRISSTAKPTTAQPTPPPPNHYKTPYLIPVGGGKDSGLTLNLITQSNEIYHTLVLEPASPAATRLAAQSSAKKLITVHRTICPTLLELNKQNYLNGHTPFSAYLAFLSTLVAHLEGHQQILLANESSANQPNLKYKNIEVNHQWSKSYEFEQSFREYANLYLASKSKQAEYLSFLRPLNEFQIAIKFAQSKNYLTQFRSCNVGQKQDMWCEQCAKCAFVFLMLFPFVEEGNLITKIFKQNLFDNISLMPTFRALADPSIDKPLDCVGTDLEVRAALQLSIEKYIRNNQQLPAVLEELAKILPKNDLSNQLLKAWNNHHFLDKKLVEILTKP